MSQVYKIVRWNGDLFYSAFIRDDSPNYKRMVRYYIGQRTYPVIKGSRLLAFDTLEHSMTFRRDMYFLGMRSSPIFKAKAGNPQPCPNILDIWPNKEVDVVAFWIDVTKPPDNLIWTPAPPGTVSCEWLELEEQVA